MGKLSEKICLWETPSRAKPKKDDDGGEALVDQSLTPLAWLCHSRQRMNFCFDVGHLRGDTPISRLKKNTCAWIRRQRCFCLLQWSKRQIKAIGGRLAALQVWPRPIIVHDPARVLNSLGRRDKKSAWRRQYVTERLSNSLKHPGRRRWRGRKIIQSLMGSEEPCVMLAVFYSDANTVYPTPTLYCIWVRALCLPVSQHYGSHSNLCHTT